MQGNLTKDQAYTLLYNYCRWDSLEDIKRLLENYRDIDVTEDEGVYFRIAMANGNYEILDTLIRHYEATQLTGTPGATEYQVAKHKLQVVLDEILEGITVENEAILERISPYISSSEGSERDDLSELEDTLPDLHYTSDDKDSSLESGDTSSDSDGRNTPDKPKVVSYLNAKALFELNQRNAQEEKKSQYTQQTKFGDLPNFSGDGTSSYLETSYWNQYSLKAMKNILDLRLKSASLDIEKAIVIHPNYVFSEETAQVFVNDLVDQISATGLGRESGRNAEQKLLIPVNLYGKHWVGIVVESADGKVKVTYMDSEGNSMPATLKECLEAELTWIYPNAGIEVTEQVVEQQASNNCGLHVIENLIAAVVGAEAKIDQKNVLAVHTTLYEQAVVEEAWQQGQTENGAPINNEQKPIWEVSSAQRDSKQPVTHYHPAIDQQAKAEPWYSGAERALTSMIGKTLESFVDALRMAMYVSPHDASDVMRSALHAGGCAVPSNPYSPELREMSLQPKFANSSKSFNDRDKFSASLPSSSLLDGIELTRGDAETWLQQFKSEAPLLGE